jgi:hypothetical protein
MRIRHPVQGTHHDVIEIYLSLCLSRERGLKQASLQLVRLVCELVNECLLNLCRPSQIKHISRLHKTTVVT